MLNKLTGKAAGSMAGKPKKRVAYPDNKGNILVVKDLRAWYGSFLALRDITMNIRPRAVTAIIGPSGCGKSTFIRCLNRMHEITPGGRVAGQVLLDGEDIYGRGADPVSIRRRIGMVFQKPNPFPTMSVFDNVVAGLKLSRLWSQRCDLEEVAERSLRQAALWDEVKEDRKSVV